MMRGNGLSTQVQALPVDRQHRAVLKNRGVFFVHEEYILRSANLYHALSDPTYLALFFLLLLLDDVIPAARHTVSRAVMQC
jgi:hypothetical protein